MTRRICEGLHEYLPWWCDQGHETKGNDPEAVAFRAWLDRLAYEQS